MSPEKIRQNNNFDLIRLILSLTIFLVHTYDLSGNPDLRIISIFLNSRTSVCAFFVISGFLVSSSYANSSSPCEYFAKRMRRLLPAYVAVVLICGFAGIALSIYSYNEYFTLSFFRYLVANLTFMNFIQPSLPGVFTRNLYQAVNGALWTIRFEMLFYMSIPLVFWLIKRVRGAVMLHLTMITTLVVFVVLLVLMKGHYGNELVTLLTYYLPVLFISFFSGVYIYIYYSKFLQRDLLYLGISVTGYVIAQIYDLQILSPLFLSGIVIYFACSFPFLGNAGKYGDLSYGIYIWHFPILQVMIGQGLFKDSTLMFILFAALIVMAAAFVSWHAIEKVFLKRSSHYRIAFDK